MSHANMTAEEMATAHEAGVKAFLAGNQTEVQGNQPLEPRLVDGVKVFDIDVTHAFWQVSKGVEKKALAYNGQILGPELPRPARRSRADRAEQPHGPATVLHFHGLTLPNAMDGVPYVTQPPVMPGESFDYEFRVTRPGCTSTTRTSTPRSRSVRGCTARSSSSRVGTWRSTYGGRAGGGVHDLPRGRSARVRPEREVVPGHDPAHGRPRDWVLIHLANDGELLHPMHLHGFHFLVVGVDGFPLSPANRYLADTLVVAPGPLRHHGEGRPARGVGLPLPHPVPRRRAGGHVRDGDGAGRGLIAARLCLEVPEPVSSGAWPRPT